MEAGQIMTTKPVVVREDATVTEAVRLMLQHRISGLPVVDAKGALVGIVTEGDFLRRAETKTEIKRPRWLEFLQGTGRLAEQYVHAHSQKVRDVMSRNVVSVAADTPLSDVIALMEKHRIKRVPVVKNGAPVGVVSRANLLNAFAAVAAEIRPVKAIDVAIRERLLAELDKAEWAPRATLDIVVRNGVVFLSGVILDERVRQALRVAAENIPGVTGVEDRLAYVDPMSGWVIEPPAAST